MTEETASRGEVLDPKVLCDELLTGSNGLVKFQVVDDDHLGLKLVIRETNRGKIEHLLEYHISRLSLLQLAARIQAAAAGSTNTSRAPMDLHYPEDKQ